jgi:glycosyltransferase involved in cell wall biosynthesis
MIEKNAITIVIIGKNEAENLPRCFISALNITSNIIFVDSDSSDNSIDIAQSFDINTIIHVKANYGTPSLSRSIGAGQVKTEFIQFLDGDMEIDENWIPFGIKHLRENENIAVVHGYKNVYKNNVDTFFVHSDKKDWEADYLQGAFLIRRECYIEAGGFDYRFYGEEERDLYVRLRESGYQVWYLHKLMSAHYDFKNKSVYYILFSGIEAGLWIPLLKAIKHNRIKSYLFVYRRLITPLICEIFTVLMLIYGITNFKYLLMGITIQAFELLYCKMINRRGYFLTWKAAFISIPKTISILKRKVKYSYDYV